MPLTSCIIASRGEGEVLQRTVADIYAKATGAIEVIVGFDGPPYQTFPHYPNFSTHIEPEVIGIKRMLNRLAELATGRYLFKTDAHCMFSPGFDETLAAHMRDNWVVTPRFYVLDADKWAWQDDRFYDAFYLCCPFTDKRGFRFKAGGHWPERTADRLHIPIDETPQMHGSAWFVNRQYFLDVLRFPEWDPFGHAQEPPWLGLGAWLGGGALMVNKKTWYSHMHQQGNRRGYHMSKVQENKSYKLHADYWMGDQRPGRVHDVDWFVDKFSPMPTWPTDWQHRLDEWRLNNKC